MFKIKTMFAAVAGLATFSVAANDTFTIEDIPNIESVLQSVVSPSGDHVAYTRKLARELYVDKDGSNFSELYVSDAKGNERPFITGQVSVRSLEWSANGEFIYFLSKMGDDKFTKLYRIPFSGGERQLVMG